MLRAARESSGAFSVATRSMPANRFANSGPSGSVVISKTSLPT